MMLRTLTFKLLKCRPVIFAESFVSKYKHIPKSASFSTKTIPPNKLNAMAQDKSLYVLPHNQTYVELTCDTAFNALTDKEKLYAHYLNQAVWKGGLIVLIQTSPESPRIFSLLHRLFNAEPMASLREASAKAGVTEEEFQALLIYASGVYGNFGNYKGFGDTKFIPNLDMESFERIVKASRAYENDNTHMTKLWQNTRDEIYSLGPKINGLGLGEKGVTTYFSSNCTQADAVLINEWMSTKRFEAWMSRAFKTKADDGKPLYTIHLASIESSPKPPLTMDKEIYKNAYFQITRGDYSPILKMVVDDLKKAIEYAANDNQREMLRHYITSFTEGDLDAHKNGSRAWIKDKAPAIESYIGFIETYRDPSGQRAEFEGFVAMVNRERSAKFQQLVDEAEIYLKRLPWSEYLEKDQFMRPDFTSLEVMSFASSGVPAGINIPNYDEVREKDGFKNVSLSNVITAAYNEPVIPFLSEEDKAMFKKYRTASFEVQVGLHELLGHGSGKLLRQLPDGSFNFDSTKIKNPVTGGKIESWYKPGETYDSKFTSLSSAMEECRAECVGLYLCSEPDVLKLFGFEGQEANDLAYTNWLAMVWNGVTKAPEIYQPTTKTWLQAHAHARFAIMRVLEEEGNGLLKVEEIKPGKDLMVTLDRERFATDGKKVIGDFLLKLQTLKSTADVKGAQELFAKYTSFDEKWLRWRDIAMLKKQPRNIFVQPNTKAEENNITLKKYPVSAEGVVLSFVDRYPNTDMDDILEGLAEADKKYFSHSSTDVDQKLV